MDQEKDDNANGPEPRPTPASVPGGPAGGVEATLSTASLCSEFQAYLAGLDRAALVEPEEVGRAGSLQFLLAVRQVRGSEPAARPALVRDIGLQYFPQGGLGLVLDNTELWTRSGENILMGLIQLETGARLSAGRHTQQPCLFWSWRTTRCWGNCWSSTSSS